MKFDIPKKWLADRIEQYGEDEECTTGNPNFMNNTEFKVILLAGCSLLGKSTYARKLINEKGYKIVCPDAIRSEFSENTSDTSHEGHVWGKAVPQKIKQLLDSKESFIFDATSLTIKSRRDFIDLVRNINKIVPIECHYFDSDLKLSLERNKIRERKLSDEAILLQFNKWCVPVTEEGFSLIKRLTDKKMSTHVARIVKVDSIQPIPGADKIRR
jgi:predicted kinase